MPATHERRILSFPIAQFIATTATVAATVHALAVAGRPGAPGLAVGGALVLTGLAAAGSIAAALSHRSLRRELATRVQGEEAARAEALTDELTETYNRRGFRALAEHQLRLARRSGEDVVVLYVDLDGFKSVNDRFGHAEGDRALRDAGTLLRNTVRAGDVVARMGGDEFAVLMVDAGPDAEAAVRARLGRALGAHNEGAGIGYALSLSLGSARLADHPGAELSELLAAADRALYRGRSERRAPGTRRRDALRLTPLGVHAA